jgi:CubicO group peptidase (beta-lactamase class C family)
MLLGGRYRRIRLPFALLLVAGALAADDRSEAVDRLLKPLRTDSAPGCAVGVLQNNQFVYRSAFGVTDLDAPAPITTATPFHVASISKQFTAAALFFLIDGGKVRLEDSVRRFIPELPALVQDVTVSDLLHHTSGLRDILPLLEAAGRPPQILDIAGDLRLLASQSALNFAPGTDYEYVNTDYLLLGLIVERVSGESLADFTEKRIFGPLGMKHSAFPGGAKQLGGIAQGYSPHGAQFHHSIPPLVAGDGGLQTSVEDLARWSENFSTAAVGGRRMIDFLEEPGHLHSGEEVRYGAGLTLAKFLGLPAIGHDGVLPGSRSDMVRFPMQHLTVISLCNRGDAEPSSLSRSIAAIYLQGKLKHRLQAADVDYPTSDFTQLAGVWESKQGWILRAWSTIEGLSVTSPQGGYRLAPLNRNQMFDEAPGWRLILTRLSPDRIRVERNGGVPVEYERLPLVTPTSTYLDAFAGEYRSSDVDATWNLTADSGRLIASINGNWRIALDAAGPDRFAGGPWSLRFRYDAEGHVKGVELHRARLWSLWFDRIEHTGTGGN